MFVRGKSSIDAMLERILSLDDLRCSCLGQFLLDIENVESKIHQNVAFGLLVCYW